jgi:hypothetical protein
MDGIPAALRGHAGSGTCLHAWCSRRWPPAARSWIACCPVRPCQPGAVCKLEVGGWLPAERPQATGRSRDVRTCVGCDARGRGYTSTRWAPQSSWNLLLRVCVRACTGGCLRALATRAPQPIAHTDQSVDWHRYSDTQIHAGARSGPHARAIVGATWDAHSGTIPSSGSLT